MENFDDFDEDDDLAAEIQAMIGSGADPNAAPTKPTKPKFQCAGARRTDEDTDKKLCNFKARKRWYGPCPTDAREIERVGGVGVGCGRFFACVPIQKDKQSQHRITLGASTMDAHKVPEYISTGFPEIDRVLGGGLLYEKTLLMGAPAGSGKTTLLLQVCDHFAKDGRKSYFASGEMTQNALLDYAKRLGIANENIALVGNPEGIDVEELFEDCLAFGAKLLIIDSVQVATVSDVKGDIGQVTMMDAVTNMVTSFAQKKKRSVLMIGHFEKTANFAGSEKMRHLVDGLIRLDRKPVIDADGQIVFRDDGKPADSMIRVVSMDEKSRQGDSNITSYIELTQTGIQSPSMKAMRAAGLHKLHAV